MEILSILNLILIILISVGLFFAKSIIEKYIPTYIEEKAKNLATKEDVQEITRKTEEVQKEFKEELELFTSDIHFKYDYYYKQYCELYSKIYGIIIQSEYLRYFLLLSEKKDISFEYAPFVEVSKTRKTNTKINLTNRETVQTSEEVSTQISEFNKMNLCQTIIDKSEFSTPKLLKLAVSYRFANTYYSGNSEGKHYSNEASANDEEFRLIRELVCCVVTEYNFLRKELKMGYDENELETGKIQL